MKLKSWCRLFILALAVLPQAVFAEEKGVALEEVVVTATKTERKVEEIPASVTVISQEDIKEMRVEKTEQILKNVEGVDLRNQGGLVPGQVTLRGISPGFSGSTTQVLINGMAMEPIQLNTSGFAWSLIRPDDIERIEIVRGPASALYGPNAVGGVINIITKKGHGTPSLDVTAGAGSHNARSYAVSGGSSIDNFSFSLDASTFETDGYKRIPTASPDGYIDFAGRDYSDDKFNASLGYRFSDGHDVSFFWNSFNDEGASYGGHPNYRLKRDGDIAGMDYANRLSSVVDLKVRLSTSDLRFDYTEDSFDPADPATTLDLTARGKTVERVANGEVQADLHLLPGNTLTAGVSYSPGEIKRHRENATGVQTWGQDSKSEVTGYYLQDEQKIGEKLIITAGGRYDRFRIYDDKRYNTTTQVYDPYPDSNDTAFNPRGGVRVNPVKGTSLWASAGTSYVPALNTLKYLGRPAFFVDNPDLNPEKSLSYELGLDQTIGGAALAKLSVFQTTYKDKIAPVSVGATTWPKQYRNIGETEVKGAEAAVEGVLADDWRPFVNYTYTDARITKNPSDPTLEGKRPFLIPYHKLNAGITYDNPKVVTVRIAGRYVGDRYWDDQNTPAKKLDPFYTADAKISKRFLTGNFLKDVTVSAAVNNVFNRQYSEYGYYEMEDGRNYWVEASLKF